MQNATLVRVAPERYLIELGPLIFEKSGVHLTHLLSYLISWTKFFIFRVIYA